MVRDLNNLIEQWEIAANTPDQLPPELSDAERVALAQKFLALGNERAKNRPSFLFGDSPDRNYARTRLFYEQQSIHNFLRESLMNAGPERIEVTDWDVVDFITGVESEQKAKTPTLRSQVTNLFKQLGFR